MLPRCRRSFFGKFMILIVVVSFFFLYLKVVNTNFDTLKTKDSPLSSALELDDNIISNDINENNINNFNRPEFAKIASTSTKSSQDDYLLYEHIVQQDLDKQEPGLGDNGEGVKLNGDAKRRGDEIYKKIALNEELSEQLSYNRTTPDARNPLCRNVDYDISILPTTSVIIIFYNEPYSVLIRTIHSVINTGDKRYLKEIILVDDASTNEVLKGKLDYYVNTRLPVGLVRIERLKNRLGLIRARLAGARKATADVLIFLDAHCEAVTGWFEPLLDRIRESRTSVLVPIIDVIDSKDFTYSTNGFRSFQVGGFHWSGHFDWIDVPKRETRRQQKECNYPKTEICPTYSPTMAGGLFAIDRKYFWEIGSYDEQMDGWGGENLEMSFRIWQCGGTIETIPCSRVGHVFRDFHPYTFPNNRDTHGINTARMALVWMDEYVNLLFMHRPDLKFHPDIGDLTHRIMLRKKLKCKNFDWFLKNVYPQKFVPTKNVQGYGQMKAMSTNLCFDDLQQSSDKPYNLGLYFCSKTMVKSQFFSLTNDGVIRTETSCATVQKSNEFLPYLVVMVPCFDSAKYTEKWHFINNQFIHIRTKMCLDHRGLKYQDYLQVTPCEIDNETQKWEIIKF